MTVRLSRAARRQIEALLRDSAERFGEAAAARYAALIAAVAEAIGREPDTAAASAVPGQPTVRAFHLRLGRKFLPVALRVGRPRHLIIYRVGGPGDIVILGLVHERMLVVRVAAELARHPEGN